MKKIGLVKLKQEFYELYKGAENAGKVEPYPPPFSAPVVTVDGKRGPLIPEIVIEQAVKGSPEAIVFIEQKMMNVSDQMKAHRKNMKEWLEFLKGKI